ASTSGLQTEGKSSALPPIKSLGGISFLPTHADLKPQIFGTAIYITEALTPAFALQAPIDLPAGTIVNRIDIHALDNSATENMQFEFYSADPATTASTLLSTVSSFSASPNITTLTMLMSPPLVIDPARTYRLRAVLRTPDMDHRLFGAKIYGAT